MGWLDRFRKPPTVAAPPAPPTPSPSVAPAPPAGPPDRQAIGSAMAAAEELMLLHPEGWQHLQLFLSATDGVPRVDRVDVTLPDEVLAPMGLHVDYGLRTAWLAEDLLGVYRALGQDPGTFASWNVHVERVSENEATLQMVGPTIHLPLDRLTCTPALLRLLHAHGQAMEDRQTALREAIGAWGWWSGWDREAHRITFEDEHGERRSLPAEIVGSFAPAESTWCWAWSNASFAPPLQAASARARDAAPPGLPLVRRGGWGCDGHFAYTAAMLAGHLMGGLPVYRAVIERTGVALFFAVEPPVGSSPTP